MAHSAPLVLVVGMHRSGTSLLGSLLQSLGVALPGDLIAGDQHNPEGYYEWRALVDVQERLLIDLDRWWPSANGCQALPPGWLDHGATRRAEEQLRQLLRQELARQRGPWAIKDPRGSRLLPLWLRLAAELRLPLRLLLALRDPAEVAASLVHRDGPITGMDPGRAQMLWWRHTLEPLHAAPADIPLALINYSAWFSSPEVQLANLLAALPEVRPSPEQRRRSLDLIRPEHRRSLASANTLPIHRSVRRLYRQLLSPGRHRWPAADPPAALARLSAPSPSLAADPCVWSDWLESRRHHPAPRHPDTAQLRPEAVISLCGLPLSHWQAHLWLQRLPIPQLAQGRLPDSTGDPHNLRIFLPPAATPDGGLERIALNLELPTPDRAAHWLDHLRGQQAIWDPCAPRVCLLRALGLPAFWLDPASAPNGWLSPGAETEGQWGACFGLPGPSPCRCLCLGEGGEAWEHALAAWEAHLGSPVVHYLPQLPLQSEPTPWQARLLASWLAASFAVAESTVALGESSFALDPAITCLEGGLPRQFQPPLTPAELLAELQGRPVAKAVDRASPDQECLLAVGGAEAPEAAVVISLFNYAETIEAALESAAAQTLAALELVVVDDASTDKSVETVRSWLARKGNRFTSARLLRHRANAGLAAARNSAFAACAAEWVFVLDADNILFPAAVEACLRQALQANASVAVVHPFVEVSGDGRHGHDGRSLISRFSWQRQAFLHGNVLDAMALVRRSAWRAVGGYTHIEGGWEDFDFWCKLIETGYHGVLSPRVLARYHTHADSMTARSTTKNWRPLSRCLQERHPWLDLPYAR